MPSLNYSPANYQLQLDHHELATIGRALALLGGHTVKVRSEEQAFARELNKKILTQRLGLLEREAEVVQKALEKATQQERGSSAEPLMGSHNL